MFTVIAGLIGTAIGGIKQHLENKQQIKKAVTENKIRLAQSAQEANHDWEMASLANAGWKDDVLFYAIIAMYVYSAVDPEGAAKVFKNWEIIPDWFRQVTFYLVASVIGVKKFGEYVPGALKNIKDVFK